MSTTPPRRRFGYTRTTRTRSVLRAFALLCLAIALAGCASAWQDVLPETADRALRAPARDCVDGLGDACSAVGEAYASGDGVERDIDRSIELMARACQSGMSSACTRWETVRLPPSATAELRTVARGCDHGSEQDCVALGEAYWRGEGVGASSADATRLLEPLCGASLRSACWSLARQAEARWRSGEERIGNVVDRYDRACEVGEAAACDALESQAIPGATPGVVAAAEACDRGDALECWSVAVFQTTTGDPALEGRGTATLVRLCDEGHGATCSDAFRMLGPDAPERDRVMARWCELSASDGCSVLGSALLERADTPQGWQDAYAALERACAAGDAPACELLPGTIESAVPADASSTVRGLARACDGGTSAACRELAAELASGRTGLSDRATELRVFVLACLVGHADVCADLPDGWLRDANWTGLRIVEARLDGRDLSDVRFERVEFSGVSLAGANLDRAEFVDVTFDGCNLDGVSLAGARFERVALSRSSLRGARAHAIDALSSTERELLEGDLHYGLYQSTYHRTSVGPVAAGFTSFADVHFTEVDLRDLEAPGFNCESCRFERCTLEGADLRGAAAATLPLSTAPMNGADLRGVFSDLEVAYDMDYRPHSLSGAQLSGANLTRAFLWQADLSHADLSGADLSRATLSEADLRSASLFDAVLQRAVLIDARLGMASLARADLRGADLQRIEYRAEHGDPANFAGARCDASTRIESSVVEQYERNGFGPIRCR